MMISGSILMQQSDQSLMINLEVVQLPCFYCSLACSAVLIYLEVTIDPSLSPPVYTKDPKMLPAVAHGNAVDKLSL